MRARLVTLTFMGCLALASSATAQRPADAAAAQALFERGRQAAQHGDWAAACAAFAESQRLDPGAGTLMNWATCEARQNQLASAWQHFNEAAALLKPGDDRAAFVNAQIRKLAPRLPRLTVRLAASAPAQTRVLRAGAELGAASLGVPTPVDPGETELLVVSPGRETRRSLVSVHEAEQVDVTLEAGDALPSPPRAPAPPAAKSTSNLSHTLGLSLVAVGSLGVGLGVASSVLVAQRKQTAQQHCPSNTCDDLGYQAAESGQTWLIVNTLAWSLGGAALVGGATLLVVGKEEQPHASVAAWPGGAAVSYTGRY
ncbi:MAG TPA: hypothetical protein VHB79_15515 [Polyangiaceae bacterium]|nr:hypothetical protein [Polyangiaceae bacterium]